MRRLTGLELKLIAMLTMVVDHIGAVFLPQYGFLRIIGRLSFPIICFLTVEGFKHTKDVYKYVARLLVFALVSEVFYDFAFYGRINWAKNNSIFTLVAGAMTLYVFEKVNFITAGVFAIIISYMMNLLGFNYALYGTFLIYMIYLADKYCAKVREYTYVAWSIIVLYMIFYQNSIQAFGAFSVVFMLLYSGEKGYKSNAVRNIFYFFYPLHLLLIFIIDFLI